MRRDLDPYVYLLASRRNGTLYLGVTSNLMQRMAQHRAATFGGFTADHGVKRLVWFEQHATMDHAILREKQLKKVAQGVEAGFDRARQPGLAGSCHRPWF